MSRWTTPPPTFPPPRRFFVETWGCQMNELDSERLTGQLMQQGILPTHDPAEADLILLNSCSVREKAAQKAYSRLGEYRLLKARREHLLLGFCGCVAQQEGERALQRVPDLDFVIGPGRVGEIRDVLVQRYSGKRVVATGFPPAEERNYALDSLARGSYKGMVTIIEGCNKKCTFCIVPQTRGPEQCRPLADILTEVRHLIDYGFVEIELLGQTVNHWRDPQSGQDFADLLEQVASLPGLLRLRFVTSYPRDFTPAMVAQFTRHPNLCPYLHLPVQSGSDRILKRMGRGYEIALYRELIAQLREARPDIALSTDIIVGFPGETADDFTQTCALVEEIRFAGLFAFKYSPRPGTAAPRLNLPPVDDTVADQRLQDLFALQKGIQRELNAELVGKTFEVLVTGWGKEPGKQVGRTACHRVVHFAVETSGPAERGPAERGPAERGPAALGRLTPVQIEQALPHSLLGRQVTAS